ncbi:hypothetical protein [Candidatus Viridilinea mediisalina]|uniref:hypothetical protein n=1 Tax=Candidatus Viridilinea mediisalina TaxID=2024553 RepID=UPI000F5B42EF|nr:hypothetical protein [Candidatus Viridilinea mediisalina]
MSFGSTRHSSLATCHSSLVTAPEQPTEDGHEQESVSPLSHRRRKPTLSPHDGPPADHEGPATIGGWE